MSSYGGFYAVGDPAQGGTAESNFRYALTQPVCTGIRLNIQWDQLQPDDAGHFNWISSMGGGHHSIDEYLYNAVQADQSICISLGAGGNTPSWVGGTTLSVFPIDNSPSTVQACTTFTAPLPWDSTYLAAYNTAVAALAAHLAVVANPNGGTIDARPWVKVIKVSGVDNTSGELRLRYGTGATTQNCTQANLNQAWGAAGFTPAAVKTAFTTLLNNYIAVFPVSAFPGIVFSVDVIFVNAFPAVDSQGTAYIPPPARTDELTRQILSEMLANATYSGVNFEVQWNALSNISPAPQPSMSALQAATGFGNCRVSYQMNERGGTAGGTWCSYAGNFSQCANDYDFETVVSTGVLLNARRLEFWGANVDQLTTVVNNLKAKSMGLPH